MSQVRCPKCKSTIRLSERLSGRKVACKCGTVLRMPKYSAPNTPNAMVDGDGLIRYRCPSCQRRLAMNSELAGKRSRCPCGIQVRVPIPQDANSPIIASLVEPTLLDLPIDAPLISQPFVDPPFVDPPFVDPPFVDPPLKEIAPVNALDAPLPVSDPFSDAPQPTSDLFSDMSPLADDLFSDASRPTNDLFADAPLEPSSPFSDAPLAISDPFSDAPSPDDQPHIIEATMIDDPFSSGLNETPANLLAPTTAPLSGDPFAHSPPPTHDGFMSAASGAPASNATHQYRRTPTGSKKRIVRHHEIREEKEWSMSGLWEILGGLGVMIGSAVWFFTALAYGDLLFYMLPLVFISGFCTFARGCWSLVST